MWCWKKLLVVSEFLYVSGWLHYSPKPFLIKTQLLVMTTFKMLLLPITFSEQKFDCLKILAKSSTWKPRASRAFYTFEIIFYPSSIRFLCIPIVLNGSWIVLDLLLLFLRIENSFFLLAECSRCITDNPWP